MNCSCQECQCKSLALPCHSDVALTQPLQDKFISLKRHRSLISKHSPRLSKCSLTPAASSPVAVWKMELNPNLSEDSVSQMHTSLVLEATSASCLRQSDRRSKVALRDIVQNTFSTLVLARTSVVLRAVSKICNTLSQIFSQ